MSDTKTRGRKLPFRVSKVIGSICLLAVLGRTSAVGGPPNVVLIFVDDLGYNDVSYNGATDIETPNIDRLAQAGVVFSSGYVVHPTCGPSRAGLMTGRYPARFGIEINFAYAPFDPEHGLPTGETTVAAYLKKAGYRTGVFGKWHLGAAPPFHPLNRGFDSFYGFLAGIHDYYHVDTTHPETGYLPLNENRSATGFKGYLTTALTNRAIEFIGEERDEPFFLYLAYNAPHYPLQAPRHLSQKYSHIADRNRRKYLAMIHSLDENVGRVVAALKETGQRNNTVVFFLSDGGGVYPTEGKEYMTWADNGPFREGKTSFLEGGIRVPFLASYPARWPQGETFEPMVSSLDIAATAMALAGVAADADRPLDGVNLDPFLVGEEAGAPHEALFWQQGLMFPPWGRFAVRAGSKKLVKNGPGETQLFDLEHDPGETRNLIDAEPKTAAWLAELWNAWNRENVNSIYPDASTYLSHRADFARELAEKFRLQGTKQPPFQIPIPDSTNNPGLVRDAEQQRVDMVPAVIVTAGAPVVGERFTVRLSNATQRAGFTQRTIWRWERGSDAAGWRGASGTRDASYQYIPSADDVGLRLRAYTWYTDLDGNRIKAVTPASDPVVGR